MGTMPGMRSAFTLVEVLITVVIMAIVVAVVVPSLTANDGARLNGAVNMVISDIEFAQSVALADPNDPGVFKASADGTGYWVATASDPVTPILAAYSNDPYSITFGAGQAAELVGVTISVAQVDDEVQFDGFGRVAGMADITVTVTNAAGSQDILVKATTGVVEIQ
jgi:prepilin-type N-terminal cleavage/methylation domain-containing protein